MMRNKTPSSMQKTYDECYLICSTAVYFEAQVCRTLISGSMLPDWGHTYLYTRYRVMKPKHYAHGAPPSIRSITTMLTGCPRIIDRHRRRKRPFETHCVTWRCNARSGWTCWRPYGRAGRRPNPADDRSATKCYREADLRQLPNQTQP